MAKGHLGLSPYLSIAFPPVNSPDPVLRVVPADRKEAPDWKMRALLFTNDACE